MFRSAIVSLLVPVILLAITACPGVLIDNIQVSFGAGGALVGATVTFTGVAPVSEAQIAQYLWDFGDVFTGSGNPANHIYQTGNIFTVTLRVVLTKGSVLIYTKTIGIGFSKMYWADITSETFSRANLDGSGYEVVLCNSGCANSNSNLDGPVGITLDLVNGHMYTTAVQGFDRIGRANLDGTGYVDLLCLGGGCPHVVGGTASNIVLDLPNGLMYWSNTQNDHIARSNLDGSNFVVLVCRTGCANADPSIDGPTGFDVDFGSGYMYWADSRTDRILRANLEGTGLTEIICNSGCTRNNSNILEPTDLKLDLYNGHIYFSDIATDRIARINLDGSGYQEIICNSGCAFNNANLQQVRGIALDVANEHIYWTDAETDHVVRTNFDGSGSIDLICNSGCVYNSSNIQGARLIALGF